MLRKWEELPAFMQTEEVRPYYEKLSRKWFSLFVKRIFDFAVSSVMLVILSPALLVLAVMIKKDSEGPVFIARNVSPSMEESSVSINSVPW